MTSVADFHGILSERLRNVKDPDDGWADYHARTEIVYNWSYPEKVKVLLDLYAEGHEYTQDVILEELQHVLARGRPLEKTLDALLPDLLELLVDDHYEDWRGII
jgi:hypothetical protein